MAIQCRAPDHHTGLPRCLTMTGLEIIVSPSIISHPVKSALNRGCRLLTIDKRFMVRGRNTCNKQKGQPHEAGLFESMSLN